MQKRLCITAVAALIFDASPFSQRLILKLELVHSPPLANTVPFDYHPTSIVIWFFCGWLGTLFTVFPPQGQLEPCPHHLQGAAVDLLTPHRRQPKRPPRRKHRKPVSKRQGNTRPHSGRVDQEVRDMTVFRRGTTASPSLGRTPCSNVPFEMQVKNRLEGQMVE